MHFTIRFLAFVFVLLCGGLHAKERVFDPRRDGFAFANETVFEYGVDDAGKLNISKRAKPVRFGHRCLCMVRGALQFWRFARFDPAAPKVSEAEYRRRVKHIFCIPVWFPPKSAASRVVIPGYANLWDFSRAHQGIVQEEIGAWLPVYFRPGNYRMGCPPMVFLQGWIARATSRAVQSGPQGLYLAHWPSLNHGVIAYAAKREKDGRISYSVYDPNYPGKSARLSYDPARGYFNFERRFYWPGGELRAFRIYDNPFH